MTIIRYDYVDPKDLASNNILQEGQGTFKIMKANTSISKNSGKEMLVITYKLTDAQGKSCLYDQYLVYNEYFASNLFKICKSIGHEEYYTPSGTDTQNLLGHVGRCEIVTEKSSQFADRSKIGKFLPFNETQQSRAVLSNDDLPEDDLPF